MKSIAIENKIYEARDEKIMLDFDLAPLYGVETRILNQAIKRNIASFPKDFMFRLTAKEWKEISSSQIVMIENIPRNRTGKYLPYAFTEHGVTMLASVLKSKKARKMNIAIVRAFISMKKLMSKSDQVLNLVRDLKKRVDGHDAQLDGIYTAIENMLEEKAEETAKQQSWQERERIGFK
jgi:phage regulator Rha-like protein